MHANVQCFFKMGHSWPLFLFSSFQYSWQWTMFNIMFCRWLDSNLGPLELEVTALPTEPQPLPLLTFNVGSKLLIIKVKTLIYYHENCVLLWWEPSSSGDGRWLIFWRTWFRIPALDTGWTFFKLICCKNCTVCLKRLKINEKEATMSFFSATFLTENELLPASFSLF